MLASMTCLVAAIVALITATCAASARESRGYGGSHSSRGYSSSRSYHPRSYAYHRTGTHTRSKREDTGWRTLKDGRHIKIND